MANERICDNDAVRDYWFFCEWLEVDGDDDGHWWYGLASFFMTVLMFGGSMVDGG